MDPPHGQRLVGLERIDHPGLAARAASMPAPPAPYARLVDLVGAEQLERVLRLPSINRLIISTDAVVCTRISTV